MLLKMFMFWLAALLVSCTTIRDKKEEIRDELKQKLKDKITEEIDKF